MSRHMSKVLTLSTFFIYSTHYTGPVVSKGPTVTGSRAQSELLDPQTPMQSLGTLHNLT